MNNNKHLSNNILKELAGLYTVASKEKNKPNDENEASFVDLKEIIAQKEDALYNLDNNKRLEKDPLKRRNVMLREASYAATGKQRQADFLKVETQSSLEQF